MPRPRRPQKRNTFTLSSLIEWVGSYLYNWIFGEESTPQRITNKSKHKKKKKKPTPVPEAVSEHEASSNEDAGTSRIDPNNRFAQLYIEADVPSPLPGLEPESHQELDDEPEEQAYTQNPYIALLMTDTNRMTPQALQERNQELMARLQKEAVVTQLQFVACTQSRRKLQTTRKELDHLNQEVAILEQRLEKMEQKLVGHNSTDYTLPSSP